MCVCLVVDPSVPSINALSSTPSVLLPSQCLFYTESKITRTFRAAPATFPLKMMMVRLDPCVRSFSSRLSSSTNTDTDTHRHTRAENGTKRECCYPQQLYTWLLNTTPLTTPLFWFASWLQQQNKTKQKNQTGRSKGGEEVNAWAHTF